MARSLKEILADKEKLAKEENAARKSEKTAAVKEVKRLINEYNLTKGDLRGKAMKQLNGDA
jgi:hypothetical protein